MGVFVVKGFGVVSVRGKGLLHKYLDPLGLCGSEETSCRLF